jgi:thiamine-phosphate pyrophosphorylase
MDAQIFLIAPADAEPATFAALLQEVLAAAPIAALLLTRGTRAENAYKALAKAVIKPAQAAGAAVLLEGEPGLVKMLGADGLHVGGDTGALRVALDALKPDFIVGAGEISSRHDAMSKGELGADYIFFGPLAGTRDPEQREMARWWAEVMTISSVLSDPAATPESAASEGSEFIGLGASLWAAPEGPAAALRAIVAGMGVLA